METHAKGTHAAARIVIAVALISSLLAIVGSALAPRVSVWELLILSLGAMLAFLVVVAVVAACSMQIRQWVLRSGGTDTQWLWFSRDPPELEKMRSGSGLGEQ